MSNHFRPFVALPLAVLGVVFSLCISAVAAPHGERRVLPDFDKRRPAEAVVVAPEKAAAAGQLRGRLREARVEVDAVSESPQFVASPHEFLTGPAGKGARCRRRARGRGARTCRIAS